MIFRDFVQKNLYFLIAIRKMMISRFSSSTGPVIGLMQGGEGEKMSSRGSKLAEGITDK